MVRLTQTKIMKSAYELAMERLKKESPSVKLTPDQKKQMAELDSIYAARVAEREIGLNSAINHARDEGKQEEVAELEQQLATEKRKLHAELEEKKEAVRSSK